MARARGMSRTSDEVTSLVAAVQEHIKFKQLAVYSIDTFCKVLAPPNPRWREYIDVAISRLMNVEGVVIPEDLALHCLQGAFGEGMGDALKAAACATLGSLARGGPTSIRAIASRGLIAHVQSNADKASRARGGDGGLAGEAASALSTLLQQALSHAAELAADPEGAAALAALLGGVRDPGLLEDALMLQI